MARIKPFKTLQEVEKSLEKATRQALEMTLEQLKEDFLKIIEEDVYNAYHPKFYTWRTRWLLRSGVVESYMGNIFGQMYGGVRINTDVDYPVSYAQFIHGSRYYDEEGSLITNTFEADDFINMLNGKIKVNPNNPWNFPVINRKPFLDDFNEWAKVHYPIYFEENLKKITGSTLEPNKNTSNTGVKLKKTINLNAYKGYGNRSISNNKTYSPDISDSGAYGADIYI